jgi:GNAT superfamily N-acetyltransferase
MAKTRIRLAEASDLDALLPVCREMEEHYRGPNALPVEDIRSQVRRALFVSETRCSQALVAEHESEIAGLAVFVKIFPAADLTMGVFLKELYVLRRYRRSLIATRLLVRLAQIAAEEGCTRIDWMCDSDNLPARLLYEKLGATIPGKVTYRLEGDRLRNVADFRLTA